MMRNETPVGNVIQVENLQRSFRVDGRIVKALDGVSLSLGHAETLGIVGESGSGKSTLGRIIAGLDRQSSGSILHEGVDLATLSRSERRKRLQNTQMIFQDPYASLNPRLRIGRQIHETLRAKGQIDKLANRVKAEELAKVVGLPEDALDRFPHEFSGGQRQRIAIARAIATDPSVIVADEPVSALDVTIREQIIVLMEELKGTTAYLFISHDMAVVARICDRIAVMYRGQVVEFGTTAEIVGNPLHDYTKNLLLAVPRIGRRRTGERLASWTPESKDLGQITMVSPTHGVRGAGHGQSGSLGIAGSFVGNSG